MGPVRWEEFASPNEREFVTVKRTFSATTAIIAELRRKSIETVYVCGLITSICVHHSAMGLVEAGFKVILVGDCCADRGKERHEMSIKLYGNYLYKTVNS